MEGIFNSMQIQKTGLLFHFLIKFVNSNRHGSGRQFTVRSQNAYSNVLALNASFQHFPPNHIFCSRYHKGQSSHERTHAVRVQLIIKSKHRLNVCPLFVFCNKSWRKTGATVWTLRRTAGFVLFICMERENADTKAGVISLQNKLQGLCFQ